MRDNWYEIKAEGADRAKLYIYGEIGEFGVPASQLVNDLNSLGGRALDVYINSKGGFVFDGIAIYNALRRYDENEGPVETTVDGLAASIASVVAQAGRKRWVGKSAALMIHDAWGIAVGNKAAMEKAADEFGRATELVAGVYAERAGKSVDYWTGRMADESWFNASEAVAAKLADEETSGAKNEYAGLIFNLSKFNKVPGWVKSQAEDPPPEAGDPPAEPGDEPEPSVQEEETTMDEKAVRQALGLDEEGDILGAITALKSAAKDIATGEKGVENRLRQELSEEREKLLAQESEYTQRILSLEASHRQKEAEYAVETAVQQGRVAPKDRDIAMKLALNDADAFKKFASGLRVDLEERGRATDSQMADLEPTKEEAEIAAQMGVTREAMAKQKAADKGITIPA